jgi:hypothetical protein
MGYKHKIVNGRKIRCERKYVIAAKIKFLRQYTQFKENGRKFVYLDETWIYQNGPNYFKRWIHETDIKSNPTVVKMEGKRFTISHAGCEDGFLNGCDYLLDAKNKTMTGELFKSWVEHQLIPALDNMGEKFVVIMDNAPYQSMQVNKPPNMSSTKR